VSDEQEGLEAVYALFFYTLLDWLGVAATISETRS